MRSDSWATEESIQPPRIVGQGVATWIENGGGHTEAVRFRTFGRPPMTMRRTIREAEAGADLDTYRQRRIAEIEERRASVTAHYEPVVEWLESHGISGAVVEAAGGSLRVDLTSEQCDLLINEFHDQLESVFLISPIEPFGTPNTGVEVREHMQVQQYWDGSYEGFGDPSSSTASRVIGVTDYDLYTTHPALNDGTGTSRLTSALIRSGSSWATYTTPSSPDTHGSMVSGLALADLTEGQDPTFPLSSGNATYDQLARTGASRQSLLAFWDVTSDITDLDTSILASQPDIVNASWGQVSSTNCFPGSYDSIANTIFHAGIPFVAAAGNDLAGTSCTVRSPALAAGSLAVGATDSRASILDIEGPYRNAINPAKGSAIGGGPFGRSIVDMIAPCRWNPITEGASSTGTMLGATSSAPYSIGTSCGSSYSAPQVTASLNLVMEFVEDAMPGIALSPGALYAIGLLMTDGADLTGWPDHITSDAFDVETGGGHLLLRLPTSDGMDAAELTPADSSTNTWEFSISSTPVHEGSSYLIPVNSGDPIPSDADYLKAAAWFFEPNYAYLMSPADIKLRLKNLTHGLTYSAAASQDQKLRAGTGVVQGDQYIIELTGTSVPTSSDPDYLYGTSFRIVNVAHYWEDGDRDDSDGPPVGID